MSAPGEGYGYTVGADGYGATDTVPSAPGAVNCPLCGAPAQGPCVGCDATVSNGAGRPYGGGMNNM